MTGRASRGDPRAVATTAGSGTGHAASLSIQFERRIPRSVLDARVVQLRACLVESQTSRVPSMLCPRSMWLPSVEEFCRRVTSQRLRASLLIALGLGLTPGCKLFGAGSTSGSSSSPAHADSCVADTKAVDDLKLKLEGDLPIKVSATLKATIYLRELSEKLDRDASDACMNIARDLDSAKVDVADSLPPGEHAKAACEEAAKRVKDARDKGGVVLLGYPQAPTCSISLEDFTLCAKDCDQTVASLGGLQCDADLSLGRCDSKCDGSCFIQNSDSCTGSCRGTCRGSCDADFYGKCGGRCNGTCDGKTSSGKCKGTCEGKCSADADGICQGKCKGECGGTCVDPVKKAKCAGSCLGKCSDPFIAPRCGAVAAPAEMVPECGAMCTARLARDARCDAGFVGLSVYNSAKEGAGDKLVHALSQPLTQLLSIAEGMKDHVDHSVEATTNAFSSLQEVLEEDKNAKEQVSDCLETASKAREEATNALQMIRDASALAVGSIKD